MKYAPVELFLKLAGQARPVGAHALQALEHQLVALFARHHTGIAFLAALVGPAHGGHQEALEMGFELQLPARSPGRTPAASHRAHQVLRSRSSCRPAATACCIGTRFLNPHEHGVRVAIDNAVPRRLDMVAGTAQDLVAAAGDGRGEARIKKTATGRAQHAVETVHDDLDGLGQGRIAAGLGRIALLPELLDQCRQDMSVAGEAPIQKTRPLSVAADNCPDTPRARPSGSMQKVRMMLGYRLLKSSSST